ncbi:MAG: hypothetical protein JWP63_2204 [Candidatus Solibacter sp.]|nr:hypothetical protein [Candidatus Solibacter sp.]
MGHSKAEKQRLTSASSQSPQSDSAKVALPEWESRN